MACPSAQRGLERLADDVLGAVARRRRVAHEARHFGRLVAERLQGDGRLGDGILRYRAARRRRRSEIVHAIAKLDEHALGGLLTDARNARQRGDVALLDQPRELLGADARQHRERDLRADAADFLQRAEQRALGLAHESVQHRRVFLDRVVREERDILAGLRQVVERRHRRLELVADAVDVDEQRRRLLGHELPAKAADHRRRLHASCGMPSRATLARTCACVSAIASASAASACSFSRRFSRTPTMCWTCVLSPAPVPTTDCLTSRAAYSLIVSPRLTTAQIAAPRAWPSFSAESAFFETNTRSTAHSCGAYSAMIVPSSSK